MADPNVTEKLDTESQTIIDEELGADATAKEAAFKERLNAIGVERDQFKTSLGLLQNQMDLLKANMPQQQTQTKQPDVLDGIFAEDDTVVDRKQFTEGINRVINTIRNDFSTVIGTLQNRIENPDGDNLIRDHLPNVIKVNPRMVANLYQLNNINPALANFFATEVAKTDPAYQEKINKQKSAQTEAQDLQQKINELLKNKNLPQSISAIGTGGGATTGGGSKLLEVLQQHETPEDFEKFHKGLLSGAEKLPKE